MTLIFNILRFLLIAVGIVFAVLWWYRPAEHFDVLLAISAGILALVEFLRNLLENKEKKRADEEAKEANRLFNERLDCVLKALKIAETGTGEAPTPDPESDEKMTLWLRGIIRGRAKVEGNLRAYATVLGVDWTGDVFQVLDRVTMSDLFREGLRSYLNVTGDIVHQSGQMLLWADHSAEVYADALWTLMRNAKPSPDFLKNARG